MTIYAKTNHRKIYESYYGPIPKDCDGRTFEIHHIDGNPLNNSKENLIALSIEEHYKIHYKQSDWIACFRISKRMKISPQEKSELARKASYARLENGTHNFLDKNAAKERALKLSKEGRHPFQLNSIKNSGKNHVRYDNTIYCFEHKITGETVYMTQSDFVKHYGLAQSNVCSMLKQRTRTVKNWRVKD